MPAKVFFNSYLCIGDLVCAQKSTVFYFCSVCGFLFALSIVLQDCLFFHLVTF
jgi:hypothetical protein